MAGKVSEYINSLRIIEISGRCPSSGARSSMAFKEKIKPLAKAEFETPFEHKVVVAIDLFYNGEKNRPDVDNVAKVLLDSLNGIAFIDDKQVVHLGCSIHDTSNVMRFGGQPIFLIDLLMKGILEYTVIRVSRA